MNFDLTHVRLMVKDVGESVRFYRDVVGLAVSGFESETYVEFGTGTGVLSIFALKEMSAVMGTLDMPEQLASQDRVALGIAVLDVDAVYETLKGRGVEFAVPPTNRPGWGLRTAHFRDPDGHLIEINQPIPMAGG